MSKTTHTRHPNPSRWEPPPVAPHVPAPFETPQVVQSATECTGLMAQPAMNEEESESLSQLYAIHPLKPQGNVGKGNPNNDPDEIAFHRGHPTGEENGKKR